MLWHAMPPELNTARLMAGAGPSPMLQAAAGWEALAASLEAEAAELAASMTALSGAWTGTGSERATAAATRMVMWLQTAAAAAQKRSMQAAAQAAAYLKALGMTPSLPEIATNHITHTVLTATNFFGINTMPIGFNEADYFVRMWNQAGGAMDVYAAETAANTVFEPLPEMSPILAPGMDAAAEAEAQAGAAGLLSTMSDEASESGPLGSATLLQAAKAAGDDDLTPTPSGVDQVSQLMNGLGQLSGPMQQLMQPLQQLTSMAGQSSSMGGSTLGDLTMGGSHVGGELGKGGAQLGLIGAPPLSSHPLLGGSGPSVGMGLMHAEQLPGSGLSGPRTSMMSQLLDKPGAVVAPAGAGAGSSAGAGAAPLGAGAGAQSAAGSKAGMSAPVALAREEDEGTNLHYDELHGIDDGDDW
ncbi:MAG: PPE family protein [Actinomycetota bacterium]|uniref:PPE family protein n=1 Tax=Mycobacterium lentiflavum TaxID=141349 RepID=A0ABY3US28_MYCLN|nr:PPE family protein [Mycobacterium lentiflavum]MEE3063609.1 PPE family protein [Actinomycetota bacterium]ULP42411.1 PPE family protein [Mycobacterium lentiflavum]